MELDVILLRKENIKYIIHKIASPNEYTIYLKGLQGGYDHCFAVSDSLCAVLTDPESGRTMTVTTDCPGVQVYTGGAPTAIGKGSVAYGGLSAVCLETQFFPDSVNHPEWKQPFTRANVPYHSVTSFDFSL